jgi:hypothetical protein
LRPAGFPSLSASSNSRARAPDFQEIRRIEFDELIDSMKTEGFLFEAGGLLSMGRTG